MADIPNIQKARELADRALSAAKLAKSNVFASKIYRDEPIIMTAAQLENYTPARYIEMRRIAQGGFQYEPEAKIFYKQGKFMEDFEDEFEFNGAFVRYFPTYNSMNLSQLRGYFSWRTKVRRGVIEKTQLSFAFVYIYELLNQIGVKSPEEGCQKLENFRAAYGEIEPKINSYVNMWLNDYVVYNNLDKSLLDGIPGADSDDATYTLLNYKNHSSDGVFSALKSLSSYNIEGSKLYRQYPGDFKNVACDVYSAISDYYENHRGTNICEKYFGRIYASPYTMFKSAVFYQAEGRHDPARVYEINDICKYRYENGAWLCERFFRYRHKNRWLGHLLKNIDLTMRLKYGFKSTLKSEKMAKIIYEIIARTVDAYHENQRKAALPKVEIDVSKLSDIRDAALQTQNKLTVGEFFDDGLLEDELEVAFENPVPGNENSADADEIERQFLIRLLRGEAYDGLIKAHGLMLSTLVDSINERFFDMFGDTVIIDRDGEPILAEDYMDALKGIIDE